MLKQSQLKMPGWASIAGISAGFVAYIVFAYLFLQPIFALAVFGGIAAIAGLTFFLKSLQNPLLIIALMPGASLVGFWGQVFEGASIPFSIFQIFLLVGTISFILHRLLARNYNIVLTGFELEFLLIFTLISFSLIYTPNYDDAIFYFVRFQIQIFVVYLLVNSIKSIVNIVYIFYGLVAVGLILALVSIWDGLLRPESVIFNYILAEKQLSYRTTGSYDDPNVFAQQFILPLTFAVSIVMAAGQKFSIRIAGAIVFALLFVAIIPTFSRSVWVALAIAIVTLTVLFRQYRLMASLFFLGVVALLFVPNIQTLAFSIVRRIGDIFAGSDDNSSSIRIMLGIAGLSMFADSWMLGVGFRGYPAMFQRYYSMVEVQGVREPHNIIYTLLAELGIVGLLLFSWLFVRLIKIAFQNFRMSRSIYEQICAGGLLGSLIAEIIFHQFYPGGLVANTVWITVGLIVASNIILKKRDVATVVAGS